MKPNTVLRRLINIPGNRCSGSSMARVLLGRHAVSFLKSGDVGMLKTGYINCMKLEDRSCAWRVSAHTMRAELKQWPDTWQIEPRA